MTTGVVYRAAHDGPSSGRAKVSVRPSPLRFGLSPVQNIPMHITRRSFLSSTAAMTPVALGVAARALAAPADQAKLTFSAPLTHSDWMLKPGVKWGLAGVRHMLDACKACGWSRIHWRTLDGGRATYPSKVVRPSYKVDAESSIWNPKTDAEKA